MVDPLLSEICNKIPPGRIHPTAHSAQRKAKCPAPVYDPSFCLRDSAAPGEPALHLRHPVRDGDSRDFPPLPVPLRFKKFHRKYLVSGAYYARLESICQQEKHVKFRTLPEVTVASCTYQGSYTQITDVYTAVIAWMEANGYEPAEPMFNIYHISPHETQNPDEFVTEICYPVKKK